MRRLRLTREVAIDTAEVVAVLVARARRAGVLLDVDGTLAPIVPRPELSQVLPEIPSILARLTKRLAVVAAISGRPSAQVRRLLDVEGVVVVGTHGLEDLPPLDDEILGELRAVAEGVGAWVEPKGAAAAVHFRGLEDPVEAAAAAEPALAEVAAAHGLEVLGGKRIVELTPPGPRKGGAVARLVDQRGLDAVLFAGDDVGDLDAFAVIHRLRTEGIWTCGVAARGPETAPEVIAAADLLVNGPVGVASLLGSLADGLEAASA